jgi:hypothetical protein
MVTPTLSKVCSVCKQELPATSFSPRKNRPSGLQSMCKSCHAIQSKESRLKNPERAADSMARYRRSELGKQNSLKAVLAYRKRYPEKRKAGSKVYKAILAEKITKPTLCEHCGVSDTNLDGHHHDYSKPLEVLWLCRKCHVRLHIEAGINP